MSDWECFVEVDWMLANDSKRILRDRGWTSINFMKLKNILTAINLHKALINAIIINVITVAVIVLDYL